jgi:hypothetical protein
MNWLTQIDFNIFFSTLPSPFSIFVLCWKITLLREVVIMEKKTRILQNKTKLRAKTNKNGTSKERL